MEKGIAGRCVSLCFRDHSACWGLMVVPQGFEKGSVRNEAEKVGKGLEYDMQLRSGANLGGSEGETENASSSILWFSGGESIFC